MPLAPALVVSPDQGNPPPLGPWPDEIQRVAHQRRYLHRLHGKRNPAGLRARDVQHVIDRVEQMASGFEDLIHRIGIARRQLAHF